MDDGCHSRIYGELWVGGTAGYMLGTARYMVILGGTAGYIHGTAGYMVGGTAGYILRTAGYMVVAHVILVSPQVP